MTRSARLANLLAVVIPFIATLAAIVVFWGHGVDAIDLGLFAVFYVLTGYGVTLGFHRLLTHKAFETRPGDSQRPRACSARWRSRGRSSTGSPTTASTTPSPMSRATRTAPTSITPAGCAASGTRTPAGSRSSRGPRHRGATPRTSSRTARCAASATRSAGSSLLSLGLPAALGFILHGFTLAGLLTGLLWGGLVRIFFVHHVTWSINSVCHFAGRRRFDVDDHSTNVAWLALPSFGEAWHHNHHAFPRSADHGLSGWERALDPSAWAVATLERTGLAWNVVRIAPERQARGCRAEPARQADSRRSWAGRPEPGRELVRRGAAG